MEGLVDITLFNGDWPAFTNSTKNVLLITERRTEACWSIRYHVFVRSYAFVTLNLQSECKNQAPKVPIRALLER